MEYFCIVLSIIFIASFFQGISGFGFGPITVPLLLLLLPPTEVVFIGILGSLCINIITLFLETKWKDIHFSNIRILLFGSFIGTFLGVWMLPFINQNILKIFLGIFLLAFVLILIFGIKKHVPNTFKNLFRIGVSCGVLGGTIAASGPPLIVLYSNQGMSKAEFKANLTVFFTLSNIVGILSMLWLRPIPPQIDFIMLAMIGTLGSIIGILLASRISEGAFRNIVYTGTFIAGLLVLGSGMGMW